MMLNAENIKFLVVRKFNQLQNKTRKRLTIINNLGSLEMNKKPTFFISSTIYDFRDLRSALKFYLEELGYQVYASEYNDFKVASDKHSYDACLKLIEECDYFILLVGSRVGGFYDDQNKISITRQEYREAYKLHEQGKLQIISFVRDEV